jgi:hypothetical protein
LIHRRWEARFEGFPHSKVIALLFIVLIITFSNNKQAFSDTNDSLLESYDENTEVYIKGKVLEIKVPEEHGPITVKLDRGSGNYTVILGPSWYYKKIDPHIKENDTIEVVGTKAFAEGRPRNVVIVARIIRNLRTNKVYFLRGKNCTCWQNCGDPLCRKSSFKRIRSIF